MGPYPRDAFISARITFRNAWLIRVWYPGPLS